MGQFAKDINLDVQEMHIVAENGDVQHVRYDQLVKIEHGSEEVKKWFRTKNVSVLRLHIRAKDEPVVVREDLMNASFDATVSALKKYADKYQVEFTTF
ncbi:hypothetical protein [Marinicrinis lubricantis]|uniref:Uncharacterized protein n=1 Tax=Marinicrinis lubricantis TaxID=2086470 RepID=A0ABW1ITG6_9BACL